MTRRLLTAVAVALAASSCSTPNPYYDPQKAHHTERGFRNSDPTAITPRPLGDFLRWQRERWSLEIPPPKTDLSANVPDLGYIQKNRSDCAVTLVGHATVFVQIGGLNILTDPQFSERAFPVRWGGSTAINLPRCAWPTATHRRRGRFAQPLRPPRPRQRQGAQCAGRRAAAVHRAAGSTNGWLAEQGVTNTKGARLVGQRRRQGRARSPRARAALEPPDADRCQPVPVGRVRARGDQTRASGAACSSAATPATRASTSRRSARSSVRSTSASFPSVPTPRAGSCSRSTSIPTRRSIPTRTSGHAVRWHPLGYVPAHRRAARPGAGRPRGRAAEVRLVERRLLHRETWRTRRLDQALNPCYP